MNVIEIGGEYFSSLAHAQSGVVCLFPVDGEGSIEQIAEKYGDDEDALMQSAKYVLIAQDGRYYALEDSGHRCFIGGPEGIQRVREGAKYIAPNGDDLVATVDGWKPVE